LASRLLGWRTVCAVEIDPYCRSVLLQRQIDGCFEPFPIWDDIRTFDPAPWRGEVDIVTGGFPCQGLSSAGKHRGLADSRSGLVFEMLWAINVIRPQHVLAENSPNLRTHGLGSILESLDSMGYDARWGVLGARHVGAPHQRNRLWIVANTDSGRRCKSEKRKMEQPRRAETVRSGNATDTDSFRRNGRSGEISEKNRGRQPQNTRQWPPEPSVGRVAHGVADRVDRLKALGNGQVPKVAALVWEILNQA
jgi:DNA (cytosine-5)-methyltransferase 1